MREQGSMFKECLIRTVLVIGSLCIALICVELGLSMLYPPEGLSLRVTRERQVDRELLYSLRPNFSNGKVTINSTGFRGDEIQKKSRYEKRVIILGDSMVFGYKVATQETFPEQLVRLYRALGRQVNVINAGVQGYGTDQSFKLFLTRLQYLGPELVVFALFSNDIGDNIDSSLYDIDHG